MQHKAATESKQTSKQTRKHTNKCNEKHHKQSNKQKTHAIDTHTNKIAAAEKLAQYIIFATLAQQGVTDVKLKVRVRRPFNLYIVIFCISATAPNLYISSWKFESCPTG